MSDVIRWKDDDLHWQGVIEAAPEYSVPFAVHVFLFKTRELMQAVFQDNQACAFSKTFNEPDTANVGALMMFNLEDLEMSLAAHESAHVALAHHSNIETSRVGAKRWLRDHPESIAEMIGNLTMLVWTALYEHGASHD